MDGSSELVSAIKDKAVNHTIQEDQLEQIVSQYCHSLKDPWPSHEDVLKAFQVFDSEGVGFIKVTMLKRFLVNAQLEVDDTNCECVYVRERGREGGREGERGRERERERENGI